MQAIFAVAVLIAGIALGLLLAQLQKSAVRKYKPLGWRRSHCGGINVSNPVTWLIIGVVILMSLLGVHLALKFFGKFVWHDEVGPWVVATKGEPWPMPNNRRVFDELYTLDRSFTLKVPGNQTGSATLSSNSIWGILRGLETFSQLIYTSKNGSSIMVRKQIKGDPPSFRHRGILLDTGRHFLPVDDILKTLDAMSYNKLNVLHWHIVDDNSFPWKSETFPELSQKGAYHPSMVYEPENVRIIIEHTRLRGNRVIPEIDTPGHTKSWGLSHQELLTTCYDSGDEPTGKYGPMNPTSEAVFDFLQTLLTEMISLFPDEYLHLGGDEVLFDCWRSNEMIRDFMKEHNLGNNNYMLENLFFSRLFNLTQTKLNRRPIVWQELFHNGLELSRDTVVQVWTGNWRNELRAITAEGLQVLLSACWYLDDVAGGGDWSKFYYDCDPLDLSMDSAEAELMIGGEACMWGEFVDRNNLHSRTWPRASAAAEKLWSNVHQDRGTIEQRLGEHACRLNRRDIPAQPPNGSGFCVL